MPDSPLPPPDDPTSPHRLPDAIRLLLGRELKHALSDAWAVTLRLGPQLVAGISAGRDFVELKRALGEADRVANALLDRGPESAPERAAIDVNAFLLQIEASLRLALDPTCTLTYRLSTTGSAVFADPQDLDRIVRQLVASAARAMPNGGEVTIGTGWLDCVAGGWPLDRLSPRRHARLTIGDIGHGQRAETWQRVLSPAAADFAHIFGGESIAALVRRLGGCLLLESADDEGSRVHVCLPAAFDNSATWPVDPDR